MSATAEGAAVTDLGRGEGQPMVADVPGILRKTELLRRVPAQDIDAVAAASRLRTFRRGQVVFTQGDPGGTLVVVVAGLLKVVVRSADGAELTLTIIHPGDTLGELSVADGGPRSADAETLETSQLLLVPREAIWDVCVREPTAALALANAVAANVRRLTEAASDLVFLDLPRRLAKVLLSLPRDADGVIRPGLRQQDLADQVGGTRQSVNTALSGFQRRGWIEVHDRTVTVKQAAALDRFAGP
jgi:CRP/FNR family transcriptional regulator, cyclic AMP receptor protein